MIKFKHKELQIAYYGRKAITAIYKGLRLIMQMGNFFTRNNELFVTKDNETFEVKEN
jgi:hypothetical protein